jgi:hypothetical protein
MKYYRLKKEAVPFFNEECATKILDLKTWKEYQVEEKALEEVEEACVYFGARYSEKSSSLCGWSNLKKKDGGAYFSFSIRFPSVKYEEFDRFSNGKIVRELMDRIQNQVSYFFHDYKNGELTEKLD